MIKLVKENIINHLNIYFCEENYKLKEVKFKNNYGLWNIDYPSLTNVLCDHSIKLEF